MEQLIFDRTQADVDYAIEHPDSEEFLKGALNYTDLNRIEEWCIYYKNYCEILGIDVEVNPVKKLTYNKYSDLLNEEYDFYARYYTYDTFFMYDSWKMTSDLYIKEINQIRQNIINLQKAFNVDSDIVIEITNKINYKQLNYMEKVLNDILPIIQERIKNFIFCGTFYSGEETISY